MIIDIRTRQKIDEAEALRRERVRIDQERRRSNAAGKHQTPKHPARGARKTEILKELDNG